MGWVKGPDQSPTRGKGAKGTERSRRVGHVGSAVVLVSYKYRQIEVGGRVRDGVGEQYARMCLVTLYESDEKCSFC